jgi:2-oxoglutarate ferredoxin oxidoreductase subunit gamma
MTERVMVAGFGGQGIMTMGHILATAGMNVGSHVTFLPTYGAEVRGGTANCQVIVSDEPIYSPVAEEADILLVLNQPSYAKFRPRLRKGGTLILNSSMAERSDEAEKARAATCLPIRATEVAIELGNIRAANVVMLGAYSAVGVVTPEALLADIQHELAGLKPHLLELNLQAFRKGRELAQAAR